MLVYAPHKLILYINIMRIELKVKSNGHSVCNKILKSESLTNQILYYISKYRMPININISQIKGSLEQGSTSMIKKTSFGLISESNEQSGQNQDDYDIAILSQQVALFESDKQIDEYIITQKLLAHDVQQKLVKLCKALILVANQQFKNKRSISSMSEISEKMTDKNVTKQQLNQIQRKCMQTLTRVQQERKKMELCAVCWESLATEVFLPCMHMVMCGKCPKVRICPICKSNIQCSKTVYR